MQYPKTLTLGATMSAPRFKDAYLECNNERDNTQRRQPWVQQWEGQDSKTPILSATMGRAILEDTIIECKNDWGNTWRRQHWVQEWACNSQSRQPWVQQWAGQYSKTPNFAATMIAERLEDANLECNNEQGKTQGRQPWVQQWAGQDSKMPTLSVTQYPKTLTLGETMSAPRLKDANLECNNEQGKA